MAAINKKYYAPLALCLFFQIVLTIVSTLSYQELYHTLYYNGKWKSTKAALAICVMGADSFLYGRQPLDKNQLNLGAWHGYQEVIYKDSITATDAYFDFKLEDGAHISFIFGKSDAGFYSVVFSNNKNFATGYYAADNLGRFADHKVIENVEIQPNTWNSAHISTNNGTLNIRLNGKSILILNANAAKINKEVGFRGGLRNSYVDNIKILSDKSTVLKEDFFNYRNICIVLVFVFFILSIISVLLIFLINKIFKAQGKYLLFYLAMINITASVCFISVFIYIRNETALYKAPDEKQLKKEAYYINLQTNITQDAIAQYIDDKQAYRHRILIAGSSQTYGAGVSSAEHTLSRNLCKILDSNTIVAATYQCTNAGVVGVSVATIRDLYKNDWSNKKFDLVILNISSNDAFNNTDDGEFRKSIREIAEVSKKRHISLVFVLEANSIESDSDNLNKLLSKHKIMRDVAMEFGVVVIDAHNAIANIHNTGYLWWDFVHLTDYGYYALAEIISSELVKQKIL